jgi:hypothetical protein
MNRFIHFVGALELVNSLSLGLYTGTRINVFVCCETGNGDSYVQAVRTFLRQGGQDDRHRK